MKQLFIILLCLASTLANAQFKQSKVALTPPMGWNSYDAYGANVHEADVKANADYMNKHLKKYGWQYVVIDFCWFYPNPPGSTTSATPQFQLQDGSYVPWLAMDKYGRLLPVVKKFPSAAGGKGFKPLADYVHSLGLKFGIHIMRGIPRQAVWAKSPVLGAKGINASMIADTSSKCTWLNSMYGLDMSKPGAQEYLNSLLKLYASWGVDFIKVDDISRPYHKAEIKGYHKAIQNCGRKIVLSLSPGETPLSEAKNVVKNANQWRVSGDFWDNWKALKYMFHLAAEWAPYAAPGHWPDLDMIPIGRLDIRGPFRPEHYSHFTHAEKRTLMTLWCIARSPLIIGGNLPDNTSEDLALETNKAVLAVNQKGLDSRQLYRNDGIVVWVSRMPDGIINVGFFNLNDNPKMVTVKFSDIGIKREATVRNLWKKKDIGVFKNKYQQSINAHGAALFQIKE